MFSNAGCGEACFSIFRFCQSAEASLPARSRAKHPHSGSVVDGIAEATKQAYSVPHLPIGGQLALIAPWQRMPVVCLHPFLECFMSPRFLPLFLVFVTASVWAQQPKNPAHSSRRITLREALARALQRSPELKIYSYDIREAEALVLQAGLKPNPELGVSLENPTGSGSYRNGEQMEQTLQLSKLLELGGKRPARIAEARASRVLIEWEYEAKRVDVLKDTTLAFVGVLAAQRVQELSKETVGLLEKSLSDANARVKAARAATVDGIRASVALRSASIEADHAEHDLNIARSKLAAMWGAKTVDFDEALGDLDRQPEEPSLDALRAKLGRNPELARFQTVREAREAALHTQKTQAVPDLTLYAGPRVVGVWHDVTGVIGFSMPLPWENKNQGNIAAAQARLDKTAEEKRAVEARAFAELNAAYQELIRAGHEAVILKTKLVPEAEQAVEQLNTSYEAGRGTQFEVLDARRTLLTARQQHLLALTEYHKALAVIEALTAAPSRTPSIHSSSTSSK